LLIVFFFHLFQYGLPGQAEAFPSSDISIPRRRMLFAFLLPFSSLSTVIFGHATLFDITSSPRPTITAFTPDASRRCLSRRPLLHRFRFSFRLSA